MVLLALLGGVVAGMVLGTIDAGLVWARGELDDIGIMWGFSEVRWIVPLIAIGLLSAARPTLRTVAFCVPLPATFLLTSICVQNIMVGFSAGSNLREIGFEMAVCYSTATAVPAAIAGALSAHLRPAKPTLGICPKCRYNLTGNQSGVCPECGTPTAAGGTEHAEPGAK